MLVLSGLRTYRPDRIERPDCRHFNHLLVVEGHHDTPTADNSSAIDQGACVIPPAIAGVILVVLGIQQKL